MYRTEKERHQLFLKKTLQRFERKKWSKSVEAVNKAQSENTKIYVDSFYSSLNTDEQEDLYYLLNQLSINWNYSRKKGYIEVEIGQINVRWFDHYEITISNDEKKSEYTISVDSNHLELLLKPGENKIKVFSVNKAGKKSKPFELELYYDTQLPWPESVRQIHKSPEVEITKEKYPFQYEDCLHPDLTYLRREYQLDLLLENSTKDLERIITLRKWVKERWSHQQPIIYPIWNSLYLLQRAENYNEGFLCFHYSILFIQCCLSLGIPCRLVNLHNHVVEDCLPGQEMRHEPKCNEHVVAECWLDDLNKWVMMDPDYDMHYEMEGIPLNILELHQLFISKRNHEAEVKMGPLTHTMNVNEADFKNRLSLFNHFSVFMRNDFLNNPNGIIRVLHYTDAHTEPILWWFGEDLAFRPTIIGPVHVAKPYKNQTSILNDGHLETSWSSFDSEENHWVIVEWDDVQEIEEMVIHWAGYHDLYYSSSTYHIKIFNEEHHDWETVQQVQLENSQPWSIHTFDKRLTRKVKIEQEKNGGFKLAPNRLCISQIEIY